MTTTLRAYARPFVVLAAILASRAALAGDDWVMEGGDAGRRSSVDCAPIRNEPVLLWKKKFDAGWIGEPVVRGGVMFLVTRAGGGQQVVSAVDVATGEVRARSVRIQCSSDWATIAASDRAVHVGAQGLAETFQWNGSFLSRSWQFVHKGFSTPAPFAGLVFSANEAYDAATGRPRPQALTTLSGGRFPISVGLHDPDHATVVSATAGPHPRYPGEWLGFEARPLSRCSAGGSSILGGELQPNLPVAQFRDAGAAANAFVVAIRLDAPQSERPGAWMFWTNAPLTTPGGLCGQVAVRIDKGRNEVLPVVARPAARGSEGFSFDAAGNLVVIRADATFEILAGAASLPQQATPSRPTIAGGVLYAATWAYDLDAKTVLWTLPSGFARPVEPAIPAGDGLFLLRGADGEIALFGDPDRPARSPEPAAAATPPVRTATAPLPSGLPVPGDGVLLRDGRQVPGKVTVDLGASQVAIEAGDGSEVVPLADVAIAESEGKTVYVASERDVHRALMTRLGRAQIPRYEALIAQALELSLASFATDYLEEARTWGIAEARAADLAKKIAAKQDPALAEPRKNGMRKKAAPVLDAVACDVRAAMEWCLARDLPAAGTVLGARLVSEREDAGPDIELLTRFIPPGFAANVRGRPLPSWRTWAPLLLDTGARFLAPNDPARRRIEAARWQGPVLAFRTPNLLFFSRTDAADIAGPCLSRGEAAIRGLQELLGVAPSARAPSDDQRIEVRLHATKEQYVDEARDPTGMIEHTLGYYSPAENVSRFYVPAGPKSGGKSGPESVSRNLFKTLAHELTHHYVEGRWIGPTAGRSGAAGRSRGYWVVEGLARFVEDQIVDADARGLTFEDPSVLSVTLAAQLARSDQLFETADLVEFDYQSFRSLEPTPKYTVQLPRSRWTYKLSPMNVFYEQSGSLVFFLRNACGPNSRARFVEYMRDVYEGDVTPPGWKALGFGSAEELDRRFKEWIATLKL